MLFFTLLACGAPEGTTAESNDMTQYHQGDVTEEEDLTGDFESCEEALVAFGEVPWHPASDAHTAYDIFDTSFDRESTRPWFAVAWEVEADPGYQISCSDYNGTKVPTEVAEAYWAAQFTANGLYIFNPEEDPDCFQMLDLEASAHGGEDYIRDEDDNVYLAEE